MDELTKLVTEIYVYCTDFIINLSNLLGASYYEMNTVIFCVIYPLLLIGLLALFIIQKRRLRKFSSPLL